MKKEIPSNKRQEFILGDCGEALNESPSLRDLAARVTEAGYKCSYETIRRDLASLNLAAMLN